MNATIPALKTIAPSDSVSAVVLDYGNVLYAWEPIAAVAGYVSADAWEEFVVDGGFLTWNERLDLGEPFEQVLSAALAGRLLPEKATSFQPKPHLGVLMRSLSDG